MNICVFGASSDSIDEKYIIKAEEFGRALALRGHSLVFGGGRQGLMGAVSRGAMSVKGCRTIGVAPKFFDLDGILEKNCTDFIYTDNMHQRKEIMENKAHAFVTVPGGIGTYEEFFEVLTLKQLGRHNKPIGIMNMYGYFDGVSQLLEKTARDGFMSSKCLELCKVTEDISEMLDYLEHYKPMDVAHLKNI